MYYLHQKSLPPLEETSRDIHGILSANLSALVCGILIDLFCLSIDTNKI